MVTITIDYDKCNRCLTCTVVCNAPKKVYEEENGKPIVKNPEACLECLYCAFVCPAKAISFENVYISKIAIYDRDSLAVFKKII